MKINFYGVYRDFLDRPQLELELPEEATIRDLLHRLSEILGQRFRERLLTEDGGLHRHVSLSVNDRLVGPSRIDEALNRGETARSEVSVLFIPALMGGGPRP